MKKQRRKHRARNRGWRGMVYLGFAVAVGSLLFSMIWVTAHPSLPFQASAKAPNGQASEQVPPYFASPAAARPFPSLLPAVDFSRYPVIERVYAVAAEIPGVLTQQPCYCDCYRMGHRSLLDCYASKHAAGCDVCLMEALFAGQKTSQGQSPATIRQEIIRGGWRNVQLD